MLVAAPPGAPSPPTTDPYAGPVTESVLPDGSLTSLVSRARAGDEEAWRQLVSRVKNAAWKAINRFRMSEPDREEVFAATLFRLADNLDTIREPEGLVSWIATTARNEALVLLRSRHRLVPSELPTLVDTDAEPHERDLERDEVRRVVGLAFAELGPDCQELLGLLVGEPPLSYREVAEILGRPIGSLGATRRRCLQKLRATEPLWSYLRESR